MPGIFDTHCHLMSSKYENEDVSQIIDDALITGVNKICNVGYDLESSRTAIKQSLEFDNVYAAIGIHPNEVANHDDNSLKKFEELVFSPEVIAVGEIGLDYYRKEVSSQLQKEWFIKQLKIAKKYNFPVLIHCRDAFDDCYEILRCLNITKGIIHSFTGSLEVANSFIELGFYISFNGIITFKNAKELQDVVRHLPLKNIVVETDAPYLSPVPYRGQKNYPEYINYTVKKIAELKKINFNEVIRITSKNSNQVFKK